MRAPRRCGRRRTRKVLRHDLAIHARDLWKRDLEHQKTFMDRVGVYVDALDEDTLAAQPNPTKALVWFLSRRDLEGVLECGGVSVHPRSGHVGPRAPGRADLLDEPLPRQ